MARDDDSDASSVSKSKSRSRSKSQEKADDGSKPRSRSRSAAARAARRTAADQGSEAFQKTPLSFSGWPRGRAENQPSGNPTRAFGGAADSMWATYPTR